MKTAILLTGAAARISQEVAIIDKLIEKKGLEINQSDTMLAGFSSGSLNIAAINGCFRDNDPKSWKEFYQKQVLFKINSGDVYKPKLPPFDTKPLRNTINNFLDNLGYKLMKELPFNSFVLTFSRSEFETLWAASFAEKQYYLNLSDVFMSSTAIPIVFPAQEINCEAGHSSNFPDGKFNDGGTGGTFAEFEQHLGEYVKEHGPFDKMYVVSPMREKSAKDTEELLKDIESDHHVVLSEHFLGNISMKTFTKFLEKLKDWNKTNGDMAKETFVCIPDLDKNFPILNFDLQEKQYNSVCDWADANPDNLAIPLNKFI